MNVNVGLMLVDKSRSATSSNTFNTFNTTQS